MLLKKITYLIFALLPLLSVAQKKDTAPLDLEDYILVKIGDTLTINLDELTILPNLFTVIPIIESLDFEDLLKSNKKYCLLNSLVYISK